MDKVLFVLSYMSEGDANSWKEEFFETAEQTASQNGGTLDLGTYNDLITKITADFSPYNTPKDVIYEMKEMRMGNNIRKKGFGPGETQVALGVSGCL